MFHLSHVCLSIPLGLCSSFIAVTITIYPLCAWKFMNIKTNVFLIFEPYLLVDCFAFLCHELVN